jgi:hypothetical protein
MRFIDTRQLIENSFDGAKDEICESVIAFEHPRHVNTYRLCAKQYHNEEEEDLNPTVSSHAECFLSKLFWL